MNPLEIRMPFGLGNRVAAMANGLSRADEITVPWRVNVHCPAPVEDVFPQGIPGVKFPPAETRIFPSVFDHIPAESWHAAADRSRANAAYEMIVSRMAGEPLEDAPAMAVFGRFHRAKLADPDALADAAGRVAKDRCEERVFLLADLHRERIAARLKIVYGLRVILPFCQALAVDMQRSRKDLADYLRDWKTLLSARLIIAADGPASALHPARAKGTPIVYSE